VNNNCSTGSTALMLWRARRSRAGLAECVLVVGFEQMEKGALGSKWTTARTRSRARRA
jgi:sterol carrier protein 2